MEEILELVVPWAVSTVILFIVLARDEARLTPDMLARAWPPATRRIAIVYFGVLALPIHFGRTRGTVRGVLLGVLWTLAISLVDEGVGDGVEEIMKRLLAS